MKRISIILTAILIFPLPFQLLAATDSLKIGMVWLLVHQAYYMPFSWLGSPFFSKDSDIGFQVEILGRIVVPVFYGLALLFLRRIVKGISANQKTKADEMTAGGSR